MKKCLGFLTVSLLVLSTSAAWAQGEYEFVEDLTPPEGELEDFGTSFDVFGDLAFIGWPHLLGDPNPPAQCGEVWVMNKGEDGRFSRSAIIQPEDCTAGDGFGLSYFEYADDVVAISAPSGRSTPAGTGNPAQTKVYFFQRDPTFAGANGFNEGWRPLGFVQPDDLSANQAVGATIRIEGDYMAVQGQTFGEVFGITFGVSNRVYIFKRSGPGGADWTQIQTINGDRDFFGLYFDLDDTGRQLVVGSPEAQTIGGAGRVFVYERGDDDQYAPKQTITGGPEGNFGYSVDVQGDELVIGAVNLADRGAAFVYQRDASGMWAQTQKLTADPRRANDLYAVWVEFEGSTLLVGAQNGLSTGGPSAGAMYIYERDVSGEYEQTQFFSNPEPTGADDPFAGYFIASGNDLLVKALGAPVGGFGQGKNQTLHYQRAGDGGSTFTVPPGISGLWYDPDRSGEGFLVDYLDGGQVVVFWFTYDSEGNQTWLIGVGQAMGSRIELDEMVITNGPTFGDQFVPSDVVREVWGSLIFEFTDCNSGTVAYAGPAGFGSGNQSLTRLSGIAGVDCGTAASKAISAGNSGAFFDAEHDGEGIQIQIVEQGGDIVPVVYWFSYDEAGKQAWFFGVGRADGDAVIVDDVLQPVGARFGDAFDPNDVELRSWGSLRIDFSTDCDEGELSYTSTLPAFGDGTQDLMRLYQTAGTACSP